MDQEFKEAMSRVSAIETMDIEKLTEASNVIFEGLVQNPVHGSLPEDVFVNYFLPYFSGKMQIDRNTTVLSDWISIAGSPNSEVDITDAAGTVLFTVPSLFDTSIVDPLKRNNANAFLSIFSQYELHNNNLPIVADNYIKRAMVDKINDVYTPPTHLSEHTNRWANILARYKVEFPISQKLVAPVDDLADDLDYG